LAKSIGNEHESDEGDEHYIQFVESREEAAESFEAAE